MPISISVGGLVPNFRRGDVRDTLEDLAAVDRRGAAWCSCLCAMTVQHMVPIDAPLTLLFLGLRWSQGMPISEARQRRATTQLRRYNQHFDPHTKERCALDAITARSRAPELASWAVANDVSQIMTDASEAGFNKHLQHLAQLVDHQLTPIAPEGPGAHPLWDWTLEHHPDPMRVGTLGDALARARRWRLRWWRPHERAIAERLSELPRWAKEAA